MTDERYSRDTRDMVIRLDVEVKALKAKVDKLDKKIDEIHDLMTQAKGAKRTIQILVWLSGTSVFVWCASYAKQIVAFFRSGV